jgi:hypothetical protein
MSVVITKEGLDYDYINYHLPYDTTTQEVKIKNLKRVLFAKPKISDGIIVHTIQYRGPITIYKGFQ